MGKKLRELRQLRLGWEKWKNNNKGDKKIRMLGMVYKSGKKWWKIGGKR
jgi:hypothetical protein